MQKGNKTCIKPIGIKEDHYTQKGEVSWQTAADKKPESAEERLARLQNI